MGIIDDLKSSPRGTKVRVIELSKFSKQTFYAALRRTKCGPAAAKAIAAAYGKPEQWPELVVVKDRHHQEVDAA